MSGDVQPRKRKDKRKKRDDRKSEGDVSIPRQPSFQDDVDDASSHGVHITKMGNEDIHLHVQHQHGTGGHWCAKIIFFVLMAVLLGLVGLIIMENRGLEDLDTPLSESRYSNYFDGWVEEHRHEDEHDAHPSHEAAVDDHDAEHDDEHDDEHDEEYEQQTGEDEEEEEEEAEEEHDEEDEDEGENTAAENITAEDDEDDNDNDDEASPEPPQSAAYDEEDDDNDDEEEDEDADEIEESIEPPVSQSKTQSAPETAEEDDEEEEEEEEAYENEDIEEPAVSQSQPETVEDQNEDDIDEDADDNDDEDIEESVEPIAESAPNAADNDDKDDNDDDDFDQLDKDDDDEDGFESLDQDVDNDAEEELLLQERQRQAAAAEQAKQQQQQQELNEEEVPTTTSWLGSLAVKFGVGIALALVSRLVLIRKNPNTNDENQPATEINMRRRLTIATAEEAIPEDGLEELPPLDDEIKPREPTGAQAVEHDNDDDLFEQELRKANAEMINEPAAHLERAQAVELMAERQHSNRLLLDAIESYKRYLAFDELIANHSEYRAAAERCIEKLRFLGHMQQAVAIHEQLIERFPAEAELRNQLSLTHLMSNNLMQLQSVAGETLKLWPRNPVANLHYGLALKQLRGDYARAVPHLQHAIDSQAKGTQEPYFYLALGESLQRLGQQAEALKIYQRGAEKRFFASVYQRSLYNEPKLRAKSFWQPAETGYARELEQLQRNWRHIRKEALSLLSSQGNFQQETEQLRDTGNWQQYELYAQGKRLQRNCQRAPITCGLIEKFPACSRGQIKFSAMQAQTHVWPHCGPTNCRLRAHLTLVAPEPRLTSLRVADEQRTWREGDLFIFDDSFEHEVWHNGTQLRLVLIIDIWHPDLSAAQRNNLTPI